MTEIPIIKQTLKDGRVFSFKDLTGIRFERLVVIGRGRLSSSDRYWECICDCGNKITTRQGRLLRGNSLSCGCLGKERLLASQKTHGLSRHPLHKVWTSILLRCYNPKDAGYKSYGAMGYVMCDEWLNDFKVFYDWAISNGWKRKLHICRKGDIGNYAPDNCYIATAKQNMQDRKSNKLNEWKARVIRVMKRNHGWSNAKQADFWGVHPSTISGIICNRGWI